MFNEIEELMQAIEKFKSNVSNSEELLSVLKSTSHKLEQYETSRKDDKKQLAKSIADIAEKLEEVTSVIENEFKMLETEIKNNKSIIAKKINLVFIGVTVLAFLIIILKYI